MKQSKSGNILFLILIAVALFAALSYTITQSGRTGSGTIEDEKEKLNQAQIDTFIAKINNGVTSLKTINRCASVDFTIPESQTAGDKSCHLFHPDGAGVIYEDLGLNECFFNEAFLDSSVETEVWLLNEAWYSVSPATACNGCASLSPTSCNLGDEVVISVGIHNCQTHPNTYNPGTNWYIASHWCGGDMKIYCHSSEQSPCGGDRGDSNASCSKSCDD